MSLGLLVSGDNDIEWFGASIISCGIYCY